MISSIVYESTSVLAALTDGMQLVAILVAALMGMGLVKLFDYLRKRDADKEAAQIVERAELEAKSLRKEAAVEAKELALQEKDRLERENNEIRNALHERERHLDKQEDALSSTERTTPETRKDGREQSASPRGKAR